MRVLSTSVAAGLAAVLAGTAAGSAAVAAPGNPAFMKPGTIDAPAPDAEMNTADVLFLREAFRGGLAEIGLGGLAKERLDAEPARDFAELMRKDHGAANEEVKAIADRMAVKLPSALDEERKAAAERLEKLDAKAFKRAYLQNQVAEHQKTMHLLIWEIGSGQNADVKAFASDKLPAILRHLEQAKRLLAETPLTP